MAVSTSKKKATLYTLQTSSPERLKDVLPNIGRRNGMAYFASLAISGPQVLVCPFQWEHAGDKEIRNHLTLEAVELLSLPADEIELNYQVFESTKEQTRGVFVCYPKKLLKSYFSVLDEAGYIPIKIVPSILAGIDSFLNQNENQQGRFCLFDFSEDNMIYFAVFSNGQCDFMREIPYESPDEVEYEVLQSLRCACGVSAVKRFDHVYLSGDVSEKDKIINRVKGSFCQNVTHGHFADIERSLRRDSNPIALNLIKNKTFSFKQRQWVQYIMRGILGLLCLAVVILGIQIVRTEIKINTIKAGYNASDFSYAQDLERKLKALR